MKVLLADVVVDSHDPPFQDTKESLDCIGMDAFSVLMPNIFLGAMLNNIVGSIVLKHERIDGKIIGHDLRVLFKVLPYDWPEILRCDTLHMNGVRSSISFHERHDRSLIALRSRPSGNLVPTADIGFVYFDSTRELA